MSIWGNLTQYRASRARLLSSISAIGSIQDCSVLSTSPCRCQAIFQPGVFKTLYEEKSLQEQYLQSGRRNTCIRRKWPLKSATGELLIQYGGEVPVLGGWHPKSSWFKWKQQSYSRRGEGRGRKGFGKLLLPLSSSTFWEEGQREQVWIPSPGTQVLSSPLRTFNSQYCQFLTCWQL